MRTLEDTALSFDRACTLAGTPYVVVGGFAVSAWGQPRTTTDVDALLDLSGQGSATALSAALASVGLSGSIRDMEEARDQGGHVTIFDEATNFHVDVKVARSARERSQIEAGRSIPFHTGRLRIARPEDTIAYKLKFGSDQDIKDARSILARQGNTLDKARLEAFAIELGVAAQLRKLVRDLENLRG